MSGNLELQELFEMLSRDRIGRDRYLVGDEYLRGLKRLDHVRGLGFGEEIRHPVEALDRHPLNVHALRLRDGVDGCELTGSETGIGSPVPIPVAVVWIL